MHINGIAVSRETLERLEHFVELFRKWAKTINLVAPSTVSDVWDRHVADSAQIFQLNPVAARWVDLGSGGGFPGVITAIFMAEIGEGWVHLVESNQKKAAFLRHALRETDALGSVHICRIEDAPESIQDIDYISARALADLDMLLAYAEPWMTANVNCKAFLHKGRDYRQETVKANGRWSFDLLEHRSAVEEDSVILEIARLRHKVN